MPNLLRDSALSGRLILLGGNCLAAEERLLRWPLEAEKEDWEASVTLAALNGPGGMEERRRREGRGDGTVSYSRRCDSTAAARACGTAEAALWYY